MARLCLAIFYYKKLIMAAGNDSTQFSIIKHLRGINFNNVYK